MTDQYAVVGNPIAHSKSPLIHEAFAKQTNQDISYERILAPLDGYSATIDRLIDEGYRGVNITVPFKFEAYQMCTYRSPEATLAGAVNTIIFRGSSIDGYNTDGIGLRRDIEQNIGFEIANKDVLILGAGGAAHGVMNSLIGAKSITIANRTLDRALELVMSLNHDNASASPFQSLDKPYDLIINATSAGLTDSELPISDVVFAKDCLAYDMMYGRETPFMAQARRNHAQVADGLGMLVEQAAEAFSLWRGVSLNTSPVIAMLRT